MRKSYLAVALLGLAPLIGACASASAKAPADRPAMNVPPPPPRVIEPSPEALRSRGIEPAEPLPEPGSEVPPLTNAGASRSPRVTAKPPAGEKPDPKAGAADPVVAEPPPVAPPPAPTPQPQLRTPQTADTSGAERNVHATVERASTMLGGVDYGPLSNDRKKAYNDAKGFIRQAEDAMKRGNLVFAQGVATKAETLARELSGK